MVAKRFLAAACLILAGVAAWAGGIRNADEFKAFIQACNDGRDLSAFSEGDTVVLAADIDLSKVKDFPQIESFHGYFDGKGHAVKGWKAGAGLFALISPSGVVRGLVIDASCSAKLSSKDVEYRFGFIADTNEGMIIDCKNYGKVSFKCNFTTHPMFIGGLVGFNRNVILHCENHGKVSADIVSGSNDPDLAMAVGGIAGGIAGKATSGSTIARCTNEGEVSLVAETLNYTVGGIIGLSNAGTLKYCVNRAPVKAESKAFENAVNGTPIGRVGGIAGLTKGEILRCDNFASVTASGAYGADVGGIVGIPHAALVVAECNNHGTITAMGEQPSNVGGIAGNVGRPVHFRACINRGKVSFEGLSAKNRSCAGGIVGNIYSPKSQNAAAYVRECINLGNINASAGGNSYGPSNNKCIHAGGIVGCASVRSDLRCHIMNCFSDGKVSCLSGRKGNICGYVSPGVKVGGSAGKVWAEEVKADADGKNVFGKVTTADGTPLEGIKVTDGRQIVLSGKDGSYSMKSDLEDSRFIYLCLPSNATVALREGMPQLFKKVPRGAEAVRADFTMELKPESRDYTVLMIADPQVRTFGMDNSMEAWHDVVAPDAEEFRASCPGEVFCINLGDLVYNYMAAWDDYIDGAAKIKCPTFNVIGNHDYDQANLFETELGNICYETYVGPEHYSFDMGNIHFVVLNTILYDRKNNEDKYHYGLDDRALEWLAADLSYVPKDKVIMTCSHHNPFKTPNTSSRGSHNYYSLHYNEYRELLKPFKAVYAWNGHNHQNFYYNYMGKDTPFGFPHLQCISVARCTGALRLNKYIGSMGEPQGYMVMNVKGDDISWYYKSVGRDQSFQMKVYAPDGNGEVLSNIWNWSEGWSTPEWFENGVKVADLEETKGLDPDYVKIFETVDDKTTRKYCKPGETRLWKVKPSAGAASGEVRVTDMFGNTYSASVSW